MYHFFPIFLLFIFCGSKTSGIRRCTHVFGSYAVRSFSFLLSGGRTFQNVQPSISRRSTIRSVTSSFTVFLMILSDVLFIASCSCLLAVRSFIPLLHVFRRLFTNIFFSGFLQRCPCLDPYEYVPYVLQGRRGVSFVLGRRPSSSGSHHHFLGPLLPLSSFLPGRPSNSQNLLGSSIIPAP